MESVNDAAPAVTTIRAVRVITPLKEISHAEVRIRDGRIESLKTTMSSLSDSSKLHQGHLLIPGMIDLHINGAGGVDVAQADGEALKRMAAILAGHGTTGFLATLITADRASLIRALANLSEGLTGDGAGAMALGVHLEGPFINPAQKGAHPEKCVQAPSLEAFQAFYEASQGRIQMLTLAPEMPGALELIEKARRQIPIVALGHSASDLEVAEEAIRRGANLAVHVFNAMRPLHHRDPGLVAAILNSGEIAAEVIADGVHVHPEMIRLLYRCKGPLKVALVTDAISAAGMPNGMYQVGPVVAELKDGVCRDSMGHLAGSALQMDEGLRNLTRWLTGEHRVELKDIVYGATRLPAMLLGMERKGRIEPGCDADLTLLDRQLGVLKTWVGGKLVYDSAAG